MPFTNFFDIPNISQILLVFFTVIIVLVVFFILCLWCSLFYIGSHIKYISTAFLPKDAMTERNAFHQ